MKTDRCAIQPGVLPKAKEANFSVVLGNGSTFEANGIPASNIRLRSIDLSDSERLRIWKNANRKFFFFQEMITRKAQKLWMEGYQQRSNDYMFIVECKNQPIGCMGFRLLDGKADIYNVILGELRYQGLGHMGLALRMLCAHIRRRFTAHIGLKVLKSNPAVRWYERNGFAVVDEAHEYFAINLDWNKFEEPSVLEKMR